MTSISLYCNSFANHLPLKSQFNQRTLICGASFLSTLLRKEYLAKDFVFDDTGTNISNLNELLGDLTGLYWVWKNTNDEFVGVNQYRRFYNEKQLTTLKDNTLYVTNFINLPMSIWDHFAYNHGHLGISCLKKAIELNKIPMSLNMFDMLYHNNKLSTCNSFIAQRNIFDKTCNVLFDIMFELYHGSKYLLDVVQENIHRKRSTKEKRVLAFLAERILTLIYFNSKYYLGNVNIVPVQFYTLKG